MARKESEDGNAVFDETSAEELQALKEAGWQISDDDIAEPDDLQDQSTGTPSRTHPRSSQKTKSRTATTRRWTTSWRKSRPSPSADADREVSVARGILMLAGLN